MAVGEGDDERQPTCAVIGDVVRSRASPDRPRLQRSVRAALEAANVRCRAVEQLQPTVGDEFQGRYASVAQALVATLVVQLCLWEVTDVRFGLGWGELTLHDPDAAPFGQDGPAWWHARAALDDLTRAGRSRGAFRGMATAVRADADDAPPAAAYTAMVACRDALVAAGDARDARLTLGLLDGLTVSECAERERISASAVSQRLRAGPYAVLASVRALGHEPAAS